MKKLLVAMLLPLAVACGEKKSDEAMAERAARVIQTTQAADSTAPESASVPGLFGTVEERLDGADYTYLRISNSTGEYWAAVPPADVKVGTLIAVEIQSEMENFKAITVNRRFDKVYLGTIGGGGGVTAPAAPAQ